jgi:hypothetical protein
MCVYKVWWSCARRMYAVKIWRILESKSEEEKVAALVLRVLKTGARLLRML